MAVKKKEPFRAPEIQEDQEDFEEMPALAEAVVETLPETLKEEAAYQVYIGPSIRGVISENAIITKNEMARIQDALVKYPDIKALLIPGENLGEARSALKKRDSYLRAVYIRLAAKA
jgi:hypothetical protein